MDKAPGHKIIGPAIAAIIDAFRDSNAAIEENIFKSIGADTADPQALSQMIESLRGHIANGLSTNGRAPSTAETATADRTSTIRYELLEAWTRLARDPGHRLTSWIANGAPAGVATHFNKLDGLYPRVQPGDQDSAEDLYTDYDSFVNYKGFDEDPDAATVIDGYIAKNYLKVFDDL